MTVSETPLSDVDLTLPVGQLKVFLAKTFDQFGNPNTETDGFTPNTIIMNVYTGSQLIDSVTFDFSSTDAFYSGSYVFQTVTDNLELQFLVDGVRPCTPWYLPSDGALCTPFCRPCRRA